LKQHDLTVTVCFTEDTPDADEIISTSFAAFLKKEIPILAVSRHFAV